MPAPKKNLIISCREQCFTRRMLYKNLLYKIHVFDEMIIGIIYYRNEWPVNSMPLSLVRNELQFTLTRQNSSPSTNIQIICNYITNTDNRILLKVLLLELSQ